MNRPMRERFVYDCSPDSEAPADRPGLSF
jgi:hypothetical protein